MGSFFFPPISEKSSQLYSSLIFSLSNWFLRSLKHMDVLYKDCDQMASVSVTTRHMQ